MSSSPDDAVKVNHRGGVARGEKVVEITEAVAPADQVTVDPDNPFAHISPFYTDEDGKARKRSQAEILIEIGSCCDLFYDNHGDTYVSIQHDGHQESYPVRSKQFKEFLSHQYLEITERGPGGTALNDALDTLSAKARFKGEERPVFFRVGESRGDQTHALYLDIGDESWSAIEIDESGWRVVDQPPIRFVRKGGMAALPLPEGGGNVRDLFCYLNVQPEDEALIVAYILASLRPTGPYWHLVLNGEQGTAKSTATRLIRSLIDPNTVPLRGRPKDEKDFSISCVNQHCVVLDNLSAFPGWLSDSFCSLATGGGLAQRKLYSDTDEILIDVQRPGILNGIEDLVTRGDMAERSICVQLQPIPESSRMPESIFWEEWNMVSGPIFGAILDAMAASLRNRDNDPPRELPRMADCLMWVMNAADALPWSAEDIRIIYDTNLINAVSIGVNASPVGRELIALMEDRYQWKGTPSELLERLERNIDQPTKRSKAWPKSATWLSRGLTRLAAPLRKMGINIETKRSYQERSIAITKTKGLHDANDAISPSDSVMEKRENHDANMTL